MRPSSTLPKSFPVIGYAEGLSFLVLLFIAMPLKYFWGMPEAVKVVGMLHGILFLLYIAMGTLLARELGWRTKSLALVYFASIIPFGPFFIDGWILKLEKSKLER